MIQWDNIGEYSDKIVQYTLIHTLDEYINDNNMSHTVLVLYFHLKDNRRKEIESFLNRIVSKEPLAIMLVGEIASKAFDYLLEILSTKSHLQHIMTYISDEKEWKDELFLATWPSEERHNSWKSYSIMEIGERRIFNELQKYLSK